MPAAITSSTRKALRRTRRAAPERAGAATRRAAAARAGGAPATAAQSAPGIWERRAGDTRDNPYLFQKSPTVLIGNDDSIVVPRGRTNIDFECEFTVVIGKRAKYVPVANAADYIFGYTAHHDVSDRGGRGDRKMGGSDWLIGKNHDTFGPLGPFIVPKEFIKDPMNTRHTMTLNGEVMQDSNTNRMSHNIYELLSYASNILTLNPGDIDRRRQPRGHEHRARRPALDAGRRHRQVRDRRHRRADQPRRGGIDRLDELAERPEKEEVECDDLLRRVGVASLLSIEGREADGISADRVSDRVSCSLLLPAAALGADEPRRSGA